MFLKFYFACTVFQAEISPREKKKTTESTFFPLLLAEMYCGALEAPLRAIITPENCTNPLANILRGTVCSYECPVGFELTGGDQYVVCQVDGIWQGSTSYCKRRYSARVMSEGDLKL